VSYVPFKIRGENIFKKRKKKKKPTQLIADFEIAL
jgi:hypothetical protein